MFYDGSVNNKINKIHERALRIAFKDTSSKFEDLLMKAVSVAIHQRILPLLTTALYKTNHELSRKFMGEIFIEEIISKSVRDNNHLSVPILRTNAYGIKVVNPSHHIKKLIFYETCESLHNNTSIYQVSDDGHS